MAISETVELLGKGLYKNKQIPDILTISAIPTVSELEFVSAEDFDKIMIEKILPQAVKEKIDFSQLLEIDYQWVLRCLRILNYGPYHTTNSIFCPNCGPQYGEFRVNLCGIDCKTLPDGFTTNDICISRDEFIDFDKTIHLSLPTVHQVLTAYKDEAFKVSDDTINRELARMCYMVTQIQGEDIVSPIDVRMIIEKQLSSADYMILKEKVHELTDYGIRAGGKTTCPKCKSTEATFVALMDDRYFRPTLRDLQQWKSDRDRGGAANPTRNKTKNV